MIIYAGVDGTSMSFNDPEYEITFKNSFVNKLSRSELVDFSDAFYHRGPSITGHETYALARMAHAWVVTCWRAGLSKAIFLAGYSRGAAAVTEVASWLKDDGIPVECLIFFYRRNSPDSGLYELVFRAREGLVLKIDEKGRPVRGRPELDETG